LSSILLTFGAALAIETELNKGMPDFIFGAVLCLINAVVLGLAVAMGARRNEEERKRRTWRQVSSPPRFYMCGNTKVIASRNDTQLLPLQGLTPAQYTIVMNVMAGQEKQEPDGDEIYMGAVQEEGLKARRSEEEQLQQVLLDPNDIVMSSKVGSNG